MKILAIDPSINHCGIAWKEGEGKVKWYELQPKLAHTEDKFGSRRLAVAKKLITCLTFLCVKDADVGIIEYPNFQTSQRGKIAATQGYTFDLAYLAGVVTAFMPQTEWYMPTPSQWKGNQTKYAIGVKFQQWTGIPPNLLSDHCFESCMMIKWYISHHQ